MTKSFGPSTQNSPIGVGHSNSLETILILKPSPISSFKLVLATLIFFFRKIDVRG